MAGEDDRTVAPLLGEEDRTVPPLLGEEDSTAALVSSFSRTILFMGMTVTWRVGLDWFR